MLKWLSRCHCLLSPGSVTFLSPWQQQPSSSVVAAFGAKPCRDLARIIQHCLPWLHPRADNGTCSSSRALPGPGNCTHPSSAKGKAPLCTGMGYRVSWVTRDRGDRPWCHLSDAQPQCTGFNTGRVDWTKATELPLHVELSHRGPIGTIKTLTEAVKGVFLHPTTDGQRFNI